ncbi:MAG: TetR/AcrR family transcriptional regulator [Haloarculaceae archaeon]
MAPAPPFLAEDGPEDTEAEIMRAAYAALCEHGYADLTIERIGEEFPKSNSLVYRHYDGKDDLLVALLESMLDHFEGREPCDGADGPRERLETLLDRAVTPPSGEDAEFESALVELRGQAPHNEDYRRHFTRADRVFRAGIAETIRRGIDQGVFREVDPDRTATVLFALLDGLRLQRATTDDGVDGEAVRAELDAYVEARLLADDTE